MLVERRIASQRELLSEVKDRPALERFENFGARIRQTGIPYQNAPLSSE